MPPASPPGNRRAASGAYVPGMTGPSIENVEGLRRLVEAVRTWAPFPDEREAAAAVEATLVALGETLLPHERQRLLEHVPPDVAAIVPAGPGVAGLDEDGLYHAAARHLPVPLVQVVEAVQVVCGEMVAAWPDLREAFVHHPLAMIFTPVRRPSAPPPTRPSAAPSSTLSGGRPGSGRPLSEGTADRAQSHSVARDETADGDRKLSSARGLTQEREHESLAEGRPDRR